MHCLYCGAALKAKKTKTGNLNKRVLKFCSVKHGSKWANAREKEKCAAAKAVRLSIKEAKRVDIENKKKAALEYALKHYMPKEDVAEKFDISAAALWHRAKKNNIKKIIAYEDGKRHIFYKPEDIDKLRMTEPDIPEGHVTANGAAAYLGMQPKSFWAVRGRTRPEATMIQWGVGSKNTKRNIYSYEDLDKWIAESERLKQERVLLSQQKRLEKRLEKETKEKQRQQDVYNKTIGAGLITAKEAAVILGICRQYLENSKTSLNPQKINGRLWFVPSEVIKLKAQREAVRLERKKNKKRIYALREDNWMSDEAYEKRKKQLARCKPAKYILNSPNAMKIWNVHTEPWRLEEEEGIITQFLCYNCEEMLPYTRFSIDIKCSSFKRFGRHRNCKVCYKEKWKRNNQTNKNKKTRGKLATQFINSILRSLNKRNGKYIAVTQRLVWKQIKDYLGYTKEDFLNHVESQFKPWMNWANNGKPKDIDNPTWQLDHIKPKSSFVYTSISDEAFAECWRLSNLKPIEARINVVKSDKELRKVLCSSFNDGIKAAVNDKKYSERGIWKFINYNPVDAKQYIESQFLKNMNWDNWGTIWHLDHIKPQAYLSYIDPYSDNFKACWDLKNLKPLMVKENCSKLSRYNNILWHYNNL